MKVKEYLEHDDYREVSFIIAKAVKDEGTAHFHAEYRTSKLYSHFEEIPYNEYYILNHKATPIEWLSGAAWGKAVKGGWAKCLLIINHEELTKLYSEKQAASIIEFIESQIKGDIL